MINQAFVLFLSVGPASAVPSPNSRNFPNVLHADPTRVGPGHTSTKKINLHSKSPRNANLVSEYHFHSSAKQLTWIVFNSSSEIK